ncbi:MAG: hypothetical protein J6O17_03320 [Eubacterium sp.]|nr:hypothetical protein [Eubacterium sp.]
MGICYICKSQISDTAASCPVCGAIQQAAPQPQQQAAAQPQVQPQQQAAPQPQGQYHGMQYGGTLQQSQPQQSQPQYGSAPQQSIPSQPQYGGAPQQSGPSQPQYGGAMQQNQPYGVSSPYNQGQPQQAPQQKQNYVQSAYSSPQQAAQGGPGGPSPEKKPVNKGLIIGLISGAAVIIAAVLLIFVFDVFGLKGGKPEAAAEAFVKAYTEMDANALVETVAPEVKNNLSEMGLGESVEEVQSSFDMLKGFGVTFDNIVIGEAQKLDVDKAKKDIKDKGGIDIEAKEAAKVTCSFNMHMEFMDESADQPTSFDLILVKQGSKWYVGDVQQLDDGEIDLGGDDPDNGGDDPTVIDGGDTFSGDAALGAAQKFMDGYSKLDVQAMMDSMSPEFRGDTGATALGSTPEEIQASFDELKEYGVSFIDTEYGEVEELDAEETKSDLKTEYGVDVVVDAAAKVKCSTKMHMEFDGESFDEPMTFYLTVVKQGNDWFVANFDEIYEEDTTEGTTEDATEGKTEGSTEGTTVTGSLGNDTPGFEKYGIKINMKKNEYYEFSTSTNDDPSVYATAKCALTEYENTPVDDELLEFGKENDMDLTGYVKKYLHYEIIFDAPEFDNNGFNYSLWVDDYYSTDLANETYESRTDSYGENYGTFKVMVNGEEKSIYYWIEWNHQQEDHWYSRPEVMILAPEGYDGVVSGISTYDGVSSDAAIFDNYDEKNFYLFRLD